MAHHTFEVTEDRISQLENKTFEIIESEEQKEKRLKNNEHIPGNCGISTKVNQHTHFGYTFALCMECKRGREII